MIVKLGGAVPVPLRPIVCGEPTALSVTERVAAKPAMEEGEKLTEIIQLPPAARVVPQVLVWAKAVGLAPVMAMLPMARVALPVLLSMAVCAALVVPATAVNVSAEGVSETAGASAVKFAVTLCGAVIVTVVAALVELATLPVQLEKL